MNKYLFPLIIFVLFTASARPCDLCGCALVHHWEDLPPPGWFGGANEQFTRYKTIQRDGQEIDNDARQKLDSSITQIFIGYNFTSSFGVQVNAPFIRRTFRRVEESGIDEGAVGGLGDVSLLANWRPIFHRSGDLTLSVRLTGGIKFPTGDSDRVKEEGAEGHSHAGEIEAETTAHDEHEEEAGHHGEGRNVFHPRHEGEEHAEPEAEHAAEETSDETGVESAVHGHDLALGTGSVDGIVGGGIFARWKALFVSADVQYAIRGDGKHDYDFANDLLWSGGLGAYVIDRPTHTLAFAFICSGETKGEDEFRGVRSNDTSMTSVFLGPKIRGTWRDRIAADLALDIPVHQENSGVQIVPDYRLRATVSWSF